MSGVKNLIQQNTGGTHVPTNEDYKEEGVGGAEGTSEKEE